MFPAGSVTLLEGYSLFFAAGCSRVFKTSSLCVYAIGVLISSFSTLYYTPRRIAISASCMCRSYMRLHIQKASVPPLYYSRTEMESRDSATATRIRVVSRLQED
jgi:hypothetical protein